MKWFFATVVSLASIAGISYNAALNHGVADGSIAGPVSVIAVLAWAAVGVEILNRNPKEQDDDE